MKLNGYEDLTIDLPEGSPVVTISLHFKTPMQALEAFEGLRKQTERGELMLKLTLGDRIPEH